MFSDSVEVNIVMVGWLVAILLGLFLLLIKTPRNNAYIHYNLGKVTYGVAFLLFGFEILFQWLMHIFQIADPILSVSVYLFVFCAASLLLAMGYCAMMSPDLVSRRQRNIALVTLSIYSIILISNYFLPVWKWRVRGLLVCCVILFLITCIGIYTTVVVYRKTISNLRKYYSDVVEDIIRWMPGVWVGVVLFLISAPFIVWLPRWYGLCQVSLGIIMFIYTFICIMNFSTNYGSVAAAWDVLEQPDGEEDVEMMSQEAIDSESRMASENRSTLSDTLKEVIREKEERWRERGGYRTSGITIDQAAREMGTNRSYLSRYLNEVRQMTFYEWVAQLRIEEAQSLMLSHPSDSIEQISTRVGFSSHSTFSSTFKKMVGMSPYRWRKLQ